MKINTKKIEPIKMRTQDSQSMSIWRATLKEDNRFVYLGFCIRNDGSIGPELNTQIGKSLDALTCMINVLKEDWMCLATNLVLFNAIVISVPL